MNRKVFVLGDLHAGSCGELIYLQSKRFPEQKELTKDDIVFQLGDFGFLWFYEEAKKYSKEAQNQEKIANFEIAKRKFTTIVIPGNHENYDEIEKLPQVEIFGAKCYEWKLQDGSIYFAKRGEIFDIDGKSYFVFGGALSVDRHYRLSIRQVDKDSNQIKNVGYWEREIPTLEEYEYALENLEKRNFKVDYVLTHTAPQSIISAMEDNFGIETKKIYDPTALYLDDFYRKYNLDFKEWHYGHFHKNWNFTLPHIERTFQCHYKEKPFLLN